MAKELHKQLYKRTATSDFVHLDEIFDNENAVEVYNLENVTEALLNQQFSNYTIVVDRGNGRHYHQYAKNKWTLWNEGSGPGPGPGPTPTTDGVAYSGFVNNVEDIDINNGTKIEFTGTQFNTAAGNGSILWFAIPSNKNIVSVENNNFSGDFIQDDLEQGDLVTVDDTEFQIYIYVFGMNFDNTYKVIIN